ncbi:ankyrin repeat domain-containing protein [Wolbachia endosymbiont (group A) of Sphecodes monilicornis]|nr:ankyrin repeat domain-containing protein [Wolbachia endosymbiont (group A) of Sphecodes monilicornis]
MERAIKHNADVNTKNNEGRTALHYATDFNHGTLWNCF